MVGDDFQIGAVQSPPADPGSKRNISRFVRVTPLGPSAWALVNVTYGHSDLVSANVGESTLSTWVHDGSWSQASGTGGVNTAADYAYVNVTSPSQQIVAPLGDPGTGPTATSGTGPGFTVSFATFAVCVLVLFVRQRKRR
jgi:hypothetical protein